VWPHPVPPELVRGLLQAVDDENPKVRLEAIYTLGTIARPPLGDEGVPQLIKALDHYDPAIRTGAARVIGRLHVKAAGDALIRATNDSNGGVRFAAMRALGAIREDRAVQALTEQFNFYGKGEGAWSALDALARIASPSSIPLFKARLADKDPFLRRAAADGLARTGDKSEISALQIGVGSDPSPMVRTAMAFALQKLGQNYIPRLVESMTSAKTAPQTADYLLELGPSIVPTLLPHLQDPSPAIRGNVAQVIGALGGPAAEAALQPRRRPGLDWHGIRPRIRRGPRLRHHRRNRGLHRRSRSGLSRRAWPDPPQCSALRTARHGVRLSELRHPLSGQRGD
jgi:HEAT repeat protein